MSRTVETTDHTTSFVDESAPVTIAAASTGSNLLTAVVGTRTPSGDGAGQAVFFWYDTPGPTNNFVGWDTPSEKVAVMSIASPGPGSFRVSYRVFGSVAPVSVDYTWNGTTMTIASGTPPTTGVAIELLSSAPATRPSGVSDAAPAASTSNPPLAAPIVGMASTHDGEGYWQVGGDGGVFTFGDAPYLGSLPGSHIVPNGPIVGMAVTPSGNGYWLVGSDGGVFAFGDAGFYGSMGGQHLNAPIVGMASDPATGGYWLVGADGGVFAFNAPFEGSEGGQHLNAPIVGMAADPNGTGYWLVGADGGIFSFGDANFYGSMGGQTLNKPVVGMASTPDGHGYWLVGADGGIFSFGDANFHGSMGGQTLNAPIVGITTPPSGAGYWLTGSDGGVFSFSVPYEGSVSQYFSPAPPPSPPSTVCSSVPGAGNAVTQWNPVVLCVLGMLGQPGTLVGDVDIVIQYESGGDPNAINLTDINAQEGHPSEGLVQVIGPTFNAYRSPLLSSNILDPAANIYAGMNYAIHRYGSIANIPGVVSVNNGGPYVPY